MTKSSQRAWKAPLTPFAARVQRALKHAALSQTDAASRLSIRLKRKISPATIQHICIKAEESALTTDLAAICGVDPEWLASNNGTEPGAPIISYTVREPTPRSKSPANTPAEKLARLIDTRAISENDMQLLLQMAERMAKHASNGA